MKTTSKLDFSIGLACFIWMTTLGAASTASRAKYVFLFIGAGMASVQINATEAYLANKIQRDEVGGENKAQLLNMSKLSVQGMCPTLPWNSYITGSAPAAAALATGKKTADGVISMDPTKTMPYTTIAEQAKAAGRREGIISSVSIDHATPACFHAQCLSRVDGSPWRLRQICLIEMRSFSLRPRVTRIETWVQRSSVSTGGSAGMSEKILPGWI